MADDAIKADVVRRFNTIPGVGLTKAEVLYDAGFTTISSLRKASADEISAVKGISSALARFIVREVKDMSDEVPVEEATTAAPSGEDPESATISVTEAVPGEEAEAGEDAEEADAAEEAPAGEEGPGFIGGLISSIKSFFASEPEMPEEGDSGLSQEEIDAAAAASETEEGAEEEGEEEKEAGPETEAATEQTEPTEASISVDHVPEDKEEAKEEPKEEADEGDKTEPQDPEGPTEEGPTMAQSAMSFATDIKEKGLARIKAIRERLRSRGKPEENEEGDSGLSQEEIEAAAAASKAEGDAKEEKEEDAGPSPPKKATDKKESDKVVDDIIKDLDLDSE